MQKEQGNLFSSSVGLGQVFILGLHAGGQHSEENWRKWLCHLSSTYRELLCPLPSSPSSPSSLSLLLHFSLLPSSSTSSSSMDKVLSWKDPSLSVQLTVSTHSHSIHPCNPFLDIGVCCGGSELGVYVLLFKKRQETVCHSGYLTDCSVFVLFCFWDTWSPKWKGFAFYDLLELWF